MGERLGDGDVGELGPGPAAERAAAGGEHQPAYLAVAAAAQALRERGVLGVDRHDLAGPLQRRLTSGPPAISDSLLASASVRPASSAASVGASPIEPVMPLSTRSHGHWASSVAASGPARIFGTGNSPAL